MKWTELLKAASQAREKAYCPYSGYAVGAAVITRQGKIYTGCNIENAAFSPGICAERTAISKAVSEGEREFEAMAIVGGKQEEPGGYCMPCGVCRQVLVEFCGAEDFILVTGEPDNYQCFSLSELLPSSFGPKSLQ
jgi:cytidine deaminase